MSQLTFELPKKDDKVKDTATLPSKRNGSLFKLVLPSKISEEKQHNNPKPHPVNSNSLQEIYETDFLQWVTKTVELLKDYRFMDLDVENLIEEVEDLGKSSQRELESRLFQLLMHLLKWQYQPIRRSYPQTINEWHENSWARTISEQRFNLRSLLTQSPSLNSKLTKLLDDCYQAARRGASKETGIDIHIFPLDCPYFEAQILSDDFWPESE